MTTLTAPAPARLPDPSDLPALLPIPPGFTARSRRRVTVDGEDAELIRYERADGRNTGLGGEHASLVVDAAGRLRGFARHHLALSDGTLPPRTQAHAVALDFLERFAPDLLPNHEVKWIEPHDETILIARGDARVAVTLPGMKVKIFNQADGRWLWVIVGTDGDVAVFERDIVWITIPGHRQTEKWLHDSWLAEQDA